MQIEEGRTDNLLRKTLFNGTRRQMSVQLLLLFSPCQRCTKRLPLQSTAHPAKNNSDNSELTAVHLGFRYKVSN